MELTEGKCDICKAEGEVFDFGRCGCEGMCEHEADWVRFLCRGCEAEMRAEDERSNALMGEHFDGEHAEHNDDCPVCQNMREPYAPQTLPSLVPLELA